MIELIAYHLAEAEKEHGDTMKMRTHLSMLSNNQSYFSPDDWRRYDEIATRYRTMIENLMAGKDAKRF